MAITISGSGITSANIADGTIVNADINSSAAIDGSKLTGAGKVLKVVEAYSTVSTTINTTAYAAIAGATITITPVATTSRILIEFSCGAYCNGATTGVGVQIKRGATAVRDMGRYAYSGNGGYVPLPITISYLDSPATTSATTYTVEAKIGTNGLEVNNGGGTNPLLIRATEIGV